MDRKPIYVTMPTLAPLENVDTLLQQIWATGIMTHNGPILQEFERKTAEFLNVNHIVVVTNGTLALQMAIRALDLKGEIITTPFTFIATISAIMWEKCTPVFVDIDPDTLDIDPSKIEAKITDKTVAIMPVHVFGNTCDVDAIDVIAKKHNLKVIYDAAHSFGVTHKGKSIYEYGDISATSFHATKMLNTVEGGACFTQDVTLFEKLKRLRFFGFDENKNIVDDGSNLKMTEVHAAVGLSNLPLMQQALDDRKEKYALYKSLLSNNSNLTFQKILSDCNYSYFPLIFPSEELLLKVDASLKSENIFSRRYFYPSVNTFTDIYKYDEMPISESISKRILCLPLYYTLLHSDIELISSIILKTL